MRMRVKEIGYGNWCKSAWMITRNLVDTGYRRMAHNELDDLGNMVVTSVMTSYCIQRSRHG